MKKTLALIVALALVVPLATGCAANPPKTSLAPTIAPTVAPAKSAVPSVAPNISPNASALPGIIEPVEPGVNEGINPGTDNNPNASPGVHPSVSPELSPGVSPGVSPNVSPGTSPSHSPGAASPSPSVSPGRTGASIPEAPSSDIEAMTDASEIAAAAAEQQNVQRAIAVQLDHTCIVGLTLKSGKKYSQAIEDAVLAAARKKNDSIAYFITANKNDVKELKKIFDSWDKTGNEEANKSAFNKMTKTLKEAAESKQKQA